MQEKSKYINGIQLHVIEDGPEDGEIIMFLHGFPEFWYSWKKQIPWFAGKGYKVIVPDQRGYNLSDKPKGIKEYTMTKLKADIVGLIKFYGRRKVYLVAHDWGAIVAWYVAAEYPDLLHKLVVINIPHPDIIKKTLRTDFFQMLRSSYAFFAQIPWLPEQIIKLSNYSILTRAMVASAKEGTFSNDDLETYKTSWQQPHNLTSMLNWYRTARYNRESIAEKIQVPTLMIWGKKEKFLLEKMAKESLPLCKKGQLYFMDDATHWLHHEKPEEVNTVIEEFLKIP